MLQVFTLQSCWSDTWNSGLFMDWLARYRRRDRALSLLESNEWVEVSCRKRRDHQERGRGGEGSPGRDVYVSSRIWERNSLWLLCCWWLCVCLILGQFGLPAALTLKLPKLLNLSQWSPSTSLRVGAPITVVRSTKIKPCNTHHRVVNSVKLEWFFFFFFFKAHSIQQKEKQFFGG